MWDGKVAFALVFAVIASAVVGRIAAAFYRKRVLALMSQGTPVLGDGAGTAPLPRASHAVRTTSFEQNRRARRKLETVIVAISLAIGLTQSWWSLQFVHTETAYGPIKLVLVGLVHAWVMVPALGLLRRWSWLRIALGSGAYMTVVEALMSMRAIEPMTIVSLASFMLFVIGTPLLAFGLAASGRARATGPYLLPLFLVLGGASIVGTDLLNLLLHNGRAAH